MKVVVVGGSGRIGTFVLRELLAPGDHEVTVFDRVAPSVSGVAWMRGETGDFGEVIGALHGADAVIHLAAYSRPGIVPDHVLFRNNVIGTYNVYEAAYRVGIRRVVSTSSSAVDGWTYGQRPAMPKYLPVDEDHPLHPHDPYSLAKLCEEQIARSYSIKGDMETIVLRPARAVFPGDRAQLRQQGGITPASFNLCAYSDVQDLAVAFRKALEAPGLKHEVLLVVNDDSICREPLCDVLPRLMPGLGDMAKSLTGDKPGVSNQRAKQVLGWQPQRSWRTTVEE